MLDTDYPYFSAPESAPAPHIEAKPLANLSGFAACWLLLLAKSVRQAAIFSLSRLKMPRRTQVQQQSDLSGGAAPDELYRLKTQVGDAGFPPKEIQQWNTHSKI